MLVYTPRPRRDRRAEEQWGFVRPVSACSPLSVQPCRQQQRGESWFGRDVHPKI